MLDPPVRDRAAGYRQAADPERVIRPCVMVVWVDAELRRHGVARQLVNAAARHVRVPASGLAWAEPFTDSGRLLARSIVPDGLVDRGLQLNSLVCQSGLTRPFQQPGWHARDTEENIVAASECLESPPLEDA